MKKPVIDLGECSLCDICVALCPEVFIKNSAGYIEVAECLAGASESDIIDAINSCRGDCISWDETTETEGV
ncbi:ferredoxin [Desulfocicer vacuolatum DSM 3385]|uniref:Ferredoxin n=1 Tax=Desulfocicer vacuolatum DSM 3385 TaxID=1121400 RepID=A0A1W2DEK8_9BACT|nr:ferredoxin [Desulfocicer vacuolatum]SMC95927.1 ferredoxin [Desulfocicer vacuolatum DSM 3385]